MNHNDNTGGPKIIPPHGGYQDLKSYQMAEIVHDATVVFCDRFIDRRSRTNDQLPAKAGKLKNRLWCRRREAESRISRRAAWLPAHPRKPN